MTAPRSAPFRRRITELKPLGILSAYASAVPGAEPPQDKLVTALEAGRQTYPLMVSGSTVVFGAGCLAAAPRAKVEILEVRECPGCEELIPTDLALKAAGLHLKAVLADRPHDPFDALLAGARLYETWALQLQRRRPGRASAEVKQDRMDLRQQLIREVFGLAQRSMERNVVVLHLPPGLQDAVRRGRLPQRAVEAAAKLAWAEQKRLADRLARGEEYSAVEAEFFGPPAGRRKTGLRAAAAIQASLHTIATEARGRADCLKLRAEDHTVALEVKSLLDGLLAAPPAATVDELVGAVVPEPRRTRGPGGGGDTVTATPGARRKPGGQ